jgi:hypothetical protein
MHCHLEVIMPPTQDIESALNRILEPFSENNERAQHSFWDWWEIGGRYSGSKAEAAFPKEKLDEFNAWMQAEGVTVSSVRCGKQELMPASQIPKIDAKWREMFGGNGPCTLFKHSNNDGTVLAGDICDLKNAIDVSCYRVIIAGPSYDRKIEASFMIAQSEWNGVNHFDTTWDGKIRSAIGMLGSKDRSDEWKESHIPKDDWLAVTVDYHS